MTTMMMDTFCTLCGAQIKMGCYGSVFHLPQSEARHSTTIREGQQGSLPLFRLLQGEKFQDWHRGTRLIEFRERGKTNQMAQMIAVIQQLKKERERAARQVAQLDAALAALDGAGRRHTGTRTLSAAARERIAAAQRARWARVKGNAQSKPTTSKKRTLSPAARKRIAAAQRARWAKVKAAKKAA